MRKGTILFSRVLILTALANFSCSSSEEKIKENDAVVDSLKYSASIPPGMADVKAEILKYSEENEDFNCKLIIREVFAYGASTSPLPPGTEIESYISKNLIQKESKKIKEGEIVFARISQTMAPGNKEYWTIIMFNKSKRGNNE